MPRIVSAAALFVLVSVVAGLILVQTSSAGTIFTVTRNDDPTPDTCLVNDCSLREAVAAANAGDGVVEVPDGMDIVLTLGEVDVTGGIDILGAGPDSSSVSGNDNDRVLNITGDAYVSGLEITHGFRGSGCGGGIFNSGETGLTNVRVYFNGSAGQGGGICNEGGLTINDSVIDDNGARGDPAGGGILNRGILQITGSSITNNTATSSSGGADGAGLANTETGEATVLYTLIEGNTGTSTACDDCSSGSGIDNDGMLEIEYSWVSNNMGDAAAGLQSKGGATVRRSLFSGNEYGAILNSTGGTMLISNTTISSNNGGPYPKAGVGGVTNYGQLSLINDTITNNSGLQFSVGGVNNGGPTGAVNYKSTIMSNNGPKNCGTTGTHNSNGYNVFDDDTCASAGSDQASTDPALGPLQDNGGPTWSHYLQASSPAINAGGPSCPTPDQLGALRVGGCDAGAVEFGGHVPTPSPSPSPTPAPVTYPLGDFDCNDDIGTGDLSMGLLAAGGLEGPGYCGRDGGCVEIATICYPWWWDVNCDGAINGADVLWILLYLAADAPDVPGGCWEIGEYAPPAN